MGIDIRLPIGGLFSLLGVLLASFGLFSNPVLYERSLGINVNLRWGLAILVFGLAMIAFGRRGIHTKRNTGQMGASDQGTTTREKH